MLRSGPRAETLQDCCKTCLFLKKSLKKNEAKTIVRTPLRLEDTWKHWTRSSPFPLRISLWNLLHAPHRAGHSTNIVLRILSDILSVLFFFFSPALVCCIEWWSVTLFSSWNNVWMSVSRTSVVHTCRIIVSSGRSTSSRLLELHFYRMLLKDWCCVMWSLNNTQSSPLCRWHTTVTSPQTLLVDCNGAVLYSLQRVQHPDGRHILRVCPAILLMTRLIGHLSEVKYKTAVIIFNISLT